MNQRTNILKVLKSNLGPGFLYRVQGRGAFHQVGKTKVGKTFGPKGKGGYRGP